MKTDIEIAYQVDIKSIVQIAETLILIRESSPGKGLWI